MNRALLIAIIVVILGVMSLGCIEKPTVEVSDIALRDVSLTSTTIDVGLIINNPNPIGVTLDKIAYDVYLVNGNQLFLAHGEKAEKMDIQANGRTTTNIPTSISNVGIIEALYQCISEEELPKIKVVGSASLNLKFFSIDIPFEKTKDVGEEIRKRIRKETKEVVEEIIEKHLDVKAPSRAEVGDRITITVTANSEPVEGATVTISRGLSEEGETTDRYGKVMWIPDDRGTYNIRASKEGYLPSVINPIYISLGEVKISDVVVNPSYYSVTFSWKTDKLASCKLTVDGILRGVTYKSTSHREEAISLRSDTTYSYIIEVVDGEGRYEGTFTTKSYFEEEVVISDVVVDPSYTSATFSWKTDKTATCELKVDGIPHGISYGTDHEEEALMLSSGKTYTFVIEVLDGEGGYEGTFTTKSLF